MRWSPMDECRIQVNISFSLMSFAVSNLYITLMQIIQQKQLLAEFFRSVSYYI